MAETKQKSDLSRAFSEDGKLKTHVGGQALLEGIMMRGKYNWSVAVREPEGGIYLEEHDLAYGQNKSGWLYWPFIRGCRAFVESLALGYKALSIAAEHAFVEEDDEAGDGADAAISGNESERAGVGGSVDEFERAGVGGSGEGCAQKLDPLCSENVADDRRSLRSALPGTPDTFVDRDGQGDDRRSIRSALPGTPGAFVDCDGQGDDSHGRSAFGGCDIDEAGRSGDREFSWKRDFGNPDEMIDALGAQRTLEVVSEPVEQPQAAGQAEAGSAELAKTEGENKKPLLGDKEMAVSMILGLVLGIVLFVVAPAFITNLIVGEYDDHTLLWNIVDGILRIGVFIFYIWLIGRMSDIKRMFGYHGAEHKTIHCFEHGLPLTPENARSFPRLHVRCGTAFLIMVMIIAIFVYTVVPLGVLIDAWGVPDGPLKLALVILVRILLMPVIAGVAYEITVKWAGAHPDNPLVKVILWPGMQMQYLTTREPDDGQIECAIAAMKLVLEREKREEALAS